MWQNHHWLCLLGLIDTTETEAVCLVWLEPIQKAHTTKSLSCPEVQTSQNRLIFAPYSNLKASHYTVSYKDSKVSSLCLGYSIDHMVPRQRQKRDVDAEADYGEVAVQKPANHLETLRGPGPSVHPGRLGKDRLISTAATHRRCAPHPFTETAHLDSTRGEQTVKLRKSLLQVP